VRHPPVLPVDRSGSGLHCASMRAPVVAASVLPVSQGRGWMRSIIRGKHTTTGWTLRAFLSFALPVGTRPVSDVRSMSNAHAVEVAGLSRLPCWIHHSPPVGRAISVRRRKRPGSRFAAGFPVPCGVMLRHHCLMPGCLFMRQMSHKPS